MKPNVFISYARKDGSDEAERLYDDLRQQGIDAWRDTQNLDPYQDFSGEIEAAIQAATHVAVCVTPDIRRADSFVRREIAFALEEHKPIIPLVFPGGRRPITIINHTFIDFTDWQAGLRALLERLKRFGVEEIDPQTRREREIAYLQAVGQRYDHWRDLYTDLAASAPVEQSKVRLKSAARYLEMQHDLFPVEMFDELREFILKYQRVALIGDPGAGKTTTLERLAYELALAAAEDRDVPSAAEKETPLPTQTPPPTPPRTRRGESTSDLAAPLPVFVRLGAYDGGDFEAFVEAAFGGLALKDYLPGRAMLLLDGLNEMPPKYHGVVDAWLRRNSETPVIVSCRKLDYLGLKLHWQRIDIAPLDVNRIYLFIGNYLEDDDRERLFWALGGQKTVAAWEWFRRTQEKATFAKFWFGKSEEDSWDELEKGYLKAVQDELREWRSLPDMLGVVSNPFLLFITVQLYARQGQPPKNKGQLFDQFITLLLEKRGKTAVKPDKPWIDAQIQRRGLAALAYRMQSEHTGTSVDEAWALKVIGEALPGTDAGLLLYFVASASIIERGKTLRFVHQLLQEYFAACEMGEDLRRGVPASKYWPDSQWWKPTGWEETALFLAGIPSPPAPLPQGEGRIDATPVVRWLTPVQPTLAYRCATESGSPCAADALQALYEPPDGARVDPIARAAGGRLLAEKGGSRPGVGVIRIAHSDDSVGAVREPPLQPGAPPFVSPRPEGEGPGVRVPGVRVIPDIAWGAEIPPGTYTIGGNEKAYNSLPAQQYTIRHPYRLAKYPVTYAQFQAFLDDAETGFNDDRWWQGLPEKYRKQPVAEQWFKYANHPRESVSWDQAVAFCRWLTWQYNVLPIFSPLSIAWRGAGGEVSSGGVEIRLPTEQEWEIAARYPDGRYFPWGNEYIPGYANIHETGEGIGGEGIGPYDLRQTSAVGLYPQGRNPASDLYDLSGNVWEWCLNNYDDPENIDMNNDETRALRGGSWDFFVHFARVASRYGDFPNFGGGIIGFRVIAVPITSFEL